MPQYDLYIRIIELILPQPSMHITHELGIGFKGKEEIIVPIQNNQHVMIPEHFKFPVVDTNDTVVVKVIGFGDVKSYAKMNVSILPLNCISRMKLKMKATDEIHENIDLVVEAHLTDACVSPFFGPMVTKIPSKSVQIKYKNGKTTIREQRIKINSPKTIRPDSKSPNPKKRQSLDQPLTPAFLSRSFPSNTV